jgi:hypothetical protein
VTDEMGCENTAEHSITPPCVALCIRLSTSPKYVCLRPHSPTSAADTCPATMFTTVSLRPHSWILCRASSIQSHSIHHHVSQEYFDMPIRQHATQAAAADIHSIWTGPGHTATYRIASSGRNVQLNHSPVPNTEV